jgi:hypothetical protein
MDDEAGCTIGNRGIYFYESAILRDRISRVHDEIGNRDRDRRKRGREEVRVIVSR